MMKLSAWVLILLVLAAAGCSEPVEPEPQPQPQPEPTPGLVDVTIEAMDFRMPPSIPAGWTTFRVHNRSAMVHLGVIEKMPEGYGLREQQDQVAPVFQDGMNRIIAGDMEGAMARFDELPEWFSEIVFTGGPGLVAPGRVAETTVFLPPGTYIMECYVKTDGLFHSYNPAPGQDGMIAEFQVVGPVSGPPAPKATLEIRISEQAGIELFGTPSAGEQVVSVFYADQKRHEHFLGHDVHLARLAEGTDMAALVAWMNWAEPAGLETPAPAEFLGGVNELPAAKRGYFKVNLEPGEYAFIAEVPNADEKRMLHRFRVE